jgi:thiol:disulfide interchange protein DsbC
MPMTRLLSIALLGAFSLTACAQAPQAPGADNKAAPASATAATGSGGSADAKVREAIKRLNPQISVEYIGVAPLPGFREVIAGGQLVYISDDGRYLVQGAVVDLQGGNRELMKGSPAMARYRADLLKSVPHADRIVFSPPNAKYTVSVFTDIECGYCRKLHSEIAEINRQGIAVEYLAFPRMGLGSQDHKDMISVWCSTDRKKALTEAKSGRPVQSRDCTNPVTMEYNIGQRVGVDGTPAIFAADGTQLGGYLPPAALRKALDDLAAEQAKAGGAP